MVWTGSHPVANAPSYALAVYGQDSCRQSHMCGTPERFCTLVTWPACVVQQVVQLSILGGSTVQADDCIA
jgi:hypothetical protein